MEINPAVFWFRYIHFQGAASPDTSCGTSSAEPVRNPAPGIVFAFGTDGDPQAAVQQLLHGGEREVVELATLPVIFEPRTGPMPPPPPEWLNQDPATLPPCTQDDYRIVGPRILDEPLSPRPYGSGIFLFARHTGEGPCHLRVMVTIDLVDGTGATIAVGGGHTLVLDTYLPGYVVQHQERELWSV